MKILTRLGGINIFLYKNLLKNGTADVRKKFVNIMLFLLISTLVESSELEHSTKENRFKRIPNDLLNFSLGNCRRMKTLVAN